MGGGDFGVGGRGSILKAKKQTGVEDQDEEERV